jgi:aconitate hydratase
MVRGTFANVRIRNLLAAGTEGGCTIHLPSGELTSIYEASVRYLADGVPLIVLAGKDYGSGSSRDWAAKGPYLQGVRAVIAESFERIHRSNLVGMGILPLQFVDGASAASLGLTGHEIFDVDGITAAVANGFAETRRLEVRARRDDGSVVEFPVSARVETPQEVLYIRHGGILQYVLRQLLGEETSQLSAPPVPKPHPEPGASAHEDPVDEGSIQSFPASDPASYSGSTKV